MSTWLIPRSDLTPEQLRVVEMPTTVHRVIFGLAGSGKTQILVHRAAHLMERYRTPQTRFRVFILTNVLRDYIRSGITFLHLPDESVCTFDSWCVEVYQRHISQSLPRKDSYGRYTPDFLKIKKTVLEFVKKRQDYRMVFDFVLVDEGQDLILETYEILQHIARHVTVFADYQQQIYENGANDRTIFEALSVHPQNVTLLGTYRNSPDVAHLASYFIDNKEKQLQYLAQIKNTQCERERPLLYVAKNLDDEMDRLASIINQRQVLNQRVGIIVPQNKHIYGLSEGLQKRGVTIEKAVPPPARTRANGTTHVHFDNMTPKIASYHSAKGLTFDCVLLPRITGKAFGQFDDDLRRRLLFVGMARAMQWIYISTVENDKPRFFPLFEEAERNNNLTIQFSSAGSPGSRESHFEEEEDDSSLL